MRVVIAEDTAILRDGLAQLLALRGHHVVAAVADATALVSAVEQHRPEVAVVDIRMPPTHTDEGLQAAIRLRREHPGVGILLFSQYIEPAYARQLLTASPAGVGYLLKERVADIDDFVEALQRVAAGGTALDPEVVSALLNSGRRGVESLTPREHEVLTRMAQGRTNGAIAADLAVSDRAVEKHVANIFTKLDLPPSETDHRRVLAVLRYLNS